ncbi:MAG: hypothetical protein AABY22_08805, partial [Nanoarchaeota archaeon]
MHKRLKYKKEKNKIIKNINNLYKQKDKVINKIHKLNSSYDKYKISASKYNNKLKKLLKNKPFKEWLNNKSKQITKLERKLYLLDAKLRNADKVYLYKELFFFSFISLFVLTYFYLDPSITSFTVLDNPLVFSETTSLNLEQNLTSLRLSGYLEGTGTGKIYLGSSLVLDTSLITSQLSQNTTNNTGNTSDIFTITNAIIHDKVEFNDMCIETCNLTESTINSDLNVNIEGNLTISITNTSYTISSAEVSEPLVLTNHTNLSLGDLNTTNTTLENNTDNEFNIPMQNITIENTTAKVTENITEELTQGKAEINKKVEWKLITKNKTIELPLESTEIIVEKIVNETNNEKEPAKLKDIFQSAVVNKEVSEPKVLIEIDELNETKLEVTYYTKAPYSIEQNL